MTAYSTFIFDSYSWHPETGVVDLHYSMDDVLKFTERLKFPMPAKSISPSPMALEQALLALHLIGGISYYKTYLPKRIEIRSGVLTKEQAAFWNSLYENGLGEFFYKNDIDFEGLINFPASALKANAPTPNPAPVASRVFVPVGGGKDSIVAWELLMAGGFSPALVRLGGHPFIDRMAEIADLHLMTIDRHLAPELFKLNAEGALNGHVPITAYLQFATLFLSLLHGERAVVMSNERSANIGNVEYRGKEINHQWSKSLEFEKMFSDYVKNFITTDVSVFSILRPMSELKIVEIFSKQAKYFDVFTSCNANWKLVKEKTATRWCGHCPKCAFVYACAAAFLDKPTLMTIFEKDLFADASLIPLYKQLLSVEGFKPFECVGTPEETAAAFILARKKANHDDTPVMQMFINDALPTIKDPKKLVEETLAMSKEHIIPKEFQKILPR
jgi:hypothetical protein